MRPFALLFVLAFVPASQDPAALIEQLKADDIEVREKAFADLERLGAGAEPELKKALPGAPLTVAVDIRKLLRILELERHFSPRLRESVPRIAQRLSLPDTEEWTQLYLKLTKSEDTPDFLSRRDVEPLAAGAIRHARDRWERIRALQEAADWCHRSAEAEALRFIHDEDEDTSKSARECVLGLRGIGSQKILVDASRSTPGDLVWLFVDYCGDDIPLVLDLLRSDDPEVVSQAADICRRHGIPGAREKAPELLKHASPRVRWKALEWLASQCRPFEGREILNLLDDPDPDVRRAAAEAGYKLQLEPEIGRLNLLLSDPDGQSNGWTWLKKLGATQELRDHLRARLKGPKDWTLRYPLELLGEVGEADDAQSLANLRPDLEGDALDAAMAAMMDLNPGFARNQLMRLVSDVHEKDEHRTSALRLLSKRGELRDFARLSGLTRDPSIAVVQAATELLVENHPGRLDADVAQRLTETNSSWTLYCIAPILVKDGTETSIAAVERALKNPNVSREAARALCLLGRTRMVSLFGRLLKDPNPQARALAVEWLGTSRATECREDVVRALEDDVVEVRISAARALASLGKGTGVDALQRLTQSDHPNLPGVVRKTLRAWGIHTSRDELRRLLTEAEWKKSELIGELIDSGDRDLTWLAEKWLKSGSKYRIEDATELIVALNLTSTRASLIPLLDHPSAKARGKVAEALAKVGKREDISRLLPLLSEPATAYEAHKALIEMKAVEAIPHLLKLAEVGEANAQYYAVEVLGALRSTEAIPVLRRKLKSDFVAIRTTAAEALGGMRDVESKDAFVAMLQDPWHGVRSSGIRALRGLGAPELADPVIPLLDDHQEWVREGARKAVCALNPQVARREFLKRIEVGSHPDREELIERLGKLGGKEAVETLIRYLGDDNLQFAAACALANLGVREAGPALIKIMAKARYSESRTLIECAARLGIVGPLEERFAGRDPLKRFEAAQFLCSTGDRRGAPVILELADLGESDMTYWTGGFGCQREDPWGQFLRYEVRPALSLLNALRKPAAWKKLVMTVIEDVHWEPREKSIEKVALAAGLGVAWDPAPSWEAEEDRSECSSLFSRRSHEEFSNAAQSLEACLDSQNSWTFIVEDDHIRMIPRLEALRFWKQWWADEQKMEKK